MATAEATLATPTEETKAGGQSATSASQRPADGDKPFTFSSSVEFRSQQDAEMVKNALDVDAELRPEQVSRQLKVDGSALIINFQAVDARTLRAAVGTFCDLLGLATRTLEAFAGEQ